MTEEEQAERRRQAEEDADPDDELMLEFHFGLIAVQEAQQGVSAATKGRGKRVRPANPASEFCRAFLQRMDEQEQSRRESGGNLTAVYVARVAARLELGQWAMKETLWPEAEGHLNEAYADARRSGLRAQACNVLKMLGHLYDMSSWFDAEPGPRLDAAAHFYKEALVYADRIGNYPQAPWVFYFLGVTYARRDETLREAVLAFDCASRFGPYEFTSLVEKQRCRLRLGERAAVIAELEPSDESGVYAFASALAAAEALKRPKRKVKLLERGIAAARANGEAVWLRWFEERLAQETATAPKPTRP